jgi:hypothetical protein
VKWRKRNEIMKIMKMKYHGVNSKKSVINGEIVISSAAKSSGENK